MSVKRYFWPFAVVVGILWLTTITVRSTAVSSVSPPSVASIKIETPVVDAVNGELARLWEANHVLPAEPTEDLTVLRRLSLALHGTIPSLEEIREFESDHSADRLDRWTESMLRDDRFSDYFAERLARSYVGVENGQFLIFRRDRFISWLTKQLQQNRAYDDIVRDMISENGVWTGEGEVNFLTSAYANNEFDPNKLTARTARAFLGQRIDCAQCHDHPFDHWTQAEFEGIAAHFAQVQLSLAGVVDGKKKEYVIDEGEVQRTVAPAVPFNPEWLGEEGTRRQKLAEWVTHSENARFELATANRIWALMFGRPFAVDLAVDDLPDPGKDPDLEMLHILGKDFREHGYDLRRLIRVIASSQAFRMSSESPHTGQQLQPGQSHDLDRVSEMIDSAERYWGVFPLVRLRPEQVIGSMLQANNIRTIDQNSHLVIRAMRFVRERDFVDEFGDPGDDELQDRSGTIPQALLRMNGKFAGELTQNNPFFAPGRISTVAATPAKKIDSIYLCCLTRLPSASERDYFLTVFEEHKSNQSVEDLFWILFNSPEFSWNH